MRTDDTLTNVTVQSNSRFVIVPDYFGDDMVYDTTTAHGLYLPAENFCLNLLNSGNAIMMTVWQSRDQDVWLDANSNRIRCLKGKSIWLAFLEASGLCGPALRRRPFRKMAGESADRVSARP